MLEGVQRTEIQWFPFLNTLPGQFLLMQPMHSDWVAYLVRVGQRQHPSLCVCGQGTFKEIIEGL